jgi:hypothetical protein
MYILIISYHRSAVVRKGIGWQFPLLAPRLIGVTYANMIMTQ